jgi:hypothetical protein
MEWWKNVFSQRDKRLLAIGAHMRASPEASILFSHHSNIPIFQHSS